MPRLQIRTINKAMAAEGIKLELVQGDGYFYFDGEGTERLYTASVHVFRLNDMSLERWLDYARGMWKEIQEKTAVDYRN